MEPEATRGQDFPSSLESVCVPFIIPSLSANHLSFASKNEKHSYSTGF